MRILLIGNFAPPYEDENLYNISLLNKLEEDGHTCTIINISEHSAPNDRFIHSKSYPGFIWKVLLHCRRKDVLHFSTKGYLRLGLLKLITSILVGTLYRTKTVITIYSELFSIQGQLRSAAGGRQALFASFAFAKKVICTDRDTYNVATIYMRKSNVELIPSFLYIPEEIRSLETPERNKLKNKEKVIFFSNVTYPSFLFDILTILFRSYRLPSDTGIVISLSGEPLSRLQHAMDKESKDMMDDLVLIDPGDLPETLAAYSRADIALRPLSCDGSTFYERFAISIKHTLNKESFRYFPSGLLVVKDGDMTDIWGSIMDTVFCAQAGPLPEITGKDSYSRILSIYEE